MPFLQVVEDLAQAEDAHGDRDKVDAVGQFEAAEGEPAFAGEDVAAHGGQQQPDGGRDSALVLAPLLMVATRRMPSSASAEYSAGPKSRAKLATTGARKVSPTMEAVPPMKEPMEARPSAVPALPCLAIGSRQRR